MNYRKTFLTIFFNIMKGCKNEIIRKIHNMSDLGSAAG